MSSDGEDMLSERADTEPGSWTLSPASLPVGAGVVGTLLILWLSSGSYESVPPTRLVRNTDTDTDT